MSMKSIVTSLPKRLTSKVNFVNVRHFFIKVISQTFPYGSPFKEEKNYNVTQH